MQISAFPPSLTAAPDTTPSHYQIGWPRLAQSLSLSLAALATSLLAITAPVMAAGKTDALKVSGPHVKDNLAVYFIHGPSRKGPVPLTLSEALRQRSVTVHETGRVERLLIENTGDREVFVQAGDIVKGGRQDRVLTISLLLPPKSGKIGIGSYCVEQGRWARRGGESAQRFGSSEAAMPSKAAKLAILSARPTKPSTPQLGQLLASRIERSVEAREAIVEQRQRTYRRLPAEAGALRREASPQHEVWRNVAEIQRKLSENLAAGIRSKQSASSLQLSLEHQKLVEAREKMASALLPIGRKDKDIVGYAFAINGKINSAEIYPSNGLFRKMWTKLIKSSVTEAIAEKAAAGGQAPDTAEVKAFLDESAKGKVEEAGLPAAKLRRERRESDKTLSLATRRSDGSMVHRTILAH